MAQQGSYPLNGRTLAANDSLTGVVTAATADVPLSVLATFVSTNLGLSTMATQSASNVAITGGSIANVTFTSGSVTVTGGSISGVTFASANATITGGAINGTPIGAVTPSTGAFTTLTATSISGLTTALSVAQGGTGRATLTAHGVLVGEGTSAINQLAVGTTGQMLLGVTGADPAFGNNPTITGGTIDNAAIGGTTPAAGKFTTLQATGAITPSTTAGIVGTTLADNANAGSVGEYQSASPTGNAMASGTIQNAASLNLSAGDWDVSGTVQFLPTGVTSFGTLIAGISTVSSTIGSVGTSNVLQFTMSNDAACHIPTPTVRINVSVSTNVFLVAEAVWTGGTMTNNAFIRARRVR